MRFGVRCQRSWEMRQKSGAERAPAEQVSEIAKVISPDIFERPIYAGNAIQTVPSSDARKVITVRGASFVAADGAATAAVEAVTPSRLIRSDPVLRSAGNTVSRISCRRRA